MTQSRSSRNTMALAAVCLAALMFGLEISSVPVILPILERVLDSDFKQLQWIMNAYTIACTTVLMAAGTLADRFGRRFIFVITIIVFGITSLICGLTHSVSLLIAGRFLQGMGGGAMMICQLAILSHQFREGRERAGAFGAWGIVFGVGLGFGPIIGGAIVALLSWQWVFLVHVILAVVTLLLVFYGVEESRDPQAKSLDVVGVITLSLAVFGLAYFITQVPDTGLTNKTTLTAIVVAAVSFVVFLIVERIHPHPMFDFSVFRVRNFSGAIMGSIGMNFSFWPLMIYLPMYFQSGLGYGVVGAGFSLLAYTLPTLVIPPLAERLALRYEPRVVIPAGMLTIGLGFFLMRLGSGAEHATWITILPGALVAGIGLGLTNTPVTNTTTGSVPPARAGMASGIDMSARLITLAINIALMGVVLVTGIYSYLSRMLPDAGDKVDLHRLAQAIAAGSQTSVKALFPQSTTLDANGTLFHDALVHGFGWVMLYGGIGVWFLALASFLIFGPSKLSSRATA